MKLRRKRNTSQSLSIDEDLNVHFNFNESAYSSRSYMEPKELENLDSCIDDISKIRYQLFQLGEALSNIQFKLDILGIRDKDFNSSIDMLFEYANLENMDTKYFNLSDLLDRLNNIRDKVHLDDE